MEASEASDVAGYAHSAAPALTECPELASAAEQNSDGYAAHWSRMLGVDEKGDSLKMKEWHLTYEALKPAIFPHLQRSLSTSGRVLDIGCGSSTIGHSVLSDFPEARLVLSDVVGPLVDRLKAEYDGNPRIEVMMDDCRNLSGLQDGSVAVAIDKGTLDALNTDEERSACLRAVSRVMQRPAGLLVSVSFAAIKRVCFLRREAAALGLALRLRLLDCGKEKRLVALLSPSFGDLEDDVDTATQEHLDRMMFRGPLWEETIVHFDRPSCSAAECLPARIELEQAPDAKRNVNVMGGVDDGTGNYLWPSCHAFCAHLCAHPELVRGKRVVELGAGTGLPGMLAAALGATEVVLTDLAGTLPLLERNFARNQALCGGRARTAELYWGPNAKELGKFDVVIGCELIFGQGDETNLALGNTIFELLSPEPGAVCFFVYEFRSSLLEDMSFFDLMEEKFEIQQIDLSPLGYGFKRKAKGVDAADDDSDGEEDWRALYVYTPKHTVASAEA